jgi:glycine/D-amino acid oxidase-like deaminating enzyme
LQNSFDVIVVGAGYIGSSVAYHLSAAKLKIALIDQGSIAAWASRANYGNIQIQDMELDKSAEMTRLAWQRFSTLEEELGRKVGLRQIGGLLTIETEAQWNIMENRLAKLRAIGIPSELIPAERLKEVEPFIDLKQLLGGLYHSAEGQVDPYMLIWGYLTRARQLGLQEIYHTEVIGFKIENNRINSVMTSQGIFNAGNVVLCSGANTSHLGQLLGKEWNVHYVLGQAMVTEPVDLVLHNHIASASFFEGSSPGNQGNILANLAISQSPHGHILLGEAMYEAKHLERFVPYQSLALVTACFERYFPSLSNLRVLRAWSAPVADCSDGCPLFGPVAGIQGLYIATAFRSTVIVTPLVGEIVTQLITSGKCELNLDNFLPERKTIHAN